ncbi:hypothetical protein ACF09Y_17475 [Streptomyces massasporeus]|uniref:hypothetical protein n=1 Tax=Streptomyces TaxID=1883 RepID=UPI0021AB0EC7|nr:hypothetical protein [Streptomyces sp. WAC04114]
MSGRQTTLTTPLGLSRLADDVEAAQLAAAETVLAGAAAVLHDPKAGERAVRFALTRAVESLGDVLRIALSRSQSQTQTRTDT